ncbi:MAG: GMP/IMP nucleotidase [Pseudomonadota bacterium]
MLSWSDVDTVMFDMDGTLLDLHFDNYFWEYLVPHTWGQSRGLTAEQAWDRLSVQYAEHNGTLNWYCIDFWTETLELDIQGMKEELRHKIALRPNVTTLLERLRAHDKQVLLVTNAHPGSLSLKMDHTGLDVHFHRTISSHDLGKAKEHDGFWEALRLVHQYDPDRSVLLDDNVAVLRSARRAGIRHLLGIEQPDSQRPPLRQEEFPQVKDFHQIMPPATPRPTTDRPVREQDRTVK